MSRHKAPPRYGPQGYAVRTVAQTAQILSITPAQAAYAERSAMEKIFKALAEDAREMGYRCVFLKTDRRGIR